jgi:hypothetical protein
VTLTIDRFVARGKIPRTLKINNGLIEQIAREQFATECARQLKRPWPIQAQVVRIRRLRVQVILTTEQVRRATIGEDWSAAFIRELRAALAHPNGIEIVRFQSRVEYLASAIRDLLHGVTAQRWAFEEFKHSFTLSTADGTLSLVEGDPSQIVPILLILETWGLLDRLFAVWDEGGLERVFAAAEVQHGGDDKALSIEDLICVVDLLLGRRPLLRGIDSSRSGLLGNRRLALKLTLGLARESDGRDARSTSPGRILHALRILDALRELHHSVEFTSWRSQMAGDKLLDSAAGSANPDILARTDDARIDRTTVRGHLEKVGSLGSDARSDLNQFWAMITSSGGTGRTSFAELFGELTSVVRSDTHRERYSEFWKIITAGSNENRSRFGELWKEILAETSSGQGSVQAARFRWITTDCAGLFLLIRVLEKLKWVDRLDQLSLGPGYGPRLVTYTLANLAATMLNRYNESPSSLDPGLVLFSGWVNEPDLGGLRHFLAAESAQLRRDILAVLLENGELEEGASGWQACFDLLATGLIHEFTALIRGFGRSSRSFVVKNFLALPGRIRLEETRLVVVFASSPLNVAVHYSGLDDPVDAVRWLGGRRIEFEMGG